MKEVILLAKRKLNFLYLWIQNSETNVEKNLNTLEEFVKRGMYLKYPFNGYKGFYYITKKSG